MICAKCGSDIPDGFKICTSCGYPQTDVPTEPVREPYRRQSIIDCPDYPSLSLNLVLGLIFSFLGVIAWSAMAIVGTRPMKKKALGGSLAVGVVFNIVLLTLPVLVAFSVVTPFGNVLLIWLVAVILLFLLSVLYVSLSTNSYKRLAIKHYGLDY